MIPRKKIIYGCEARGDADSPYLTRYVLFSCKFFAIYLHIFHRSDADDLHDHPWNFWTLILWRGYTEETPMGRRRLWPGMFTYRPAKWRHRVELIGGKNAVTLVVRGRSFQDWGFWENGKFVYWKEYFWKKGC